METIVKKIPTEDMIHFTKIVTLAYPGWKLVTNEQLKKVNERNIFIQEQLDHTYIYGAYRQEKLLGGMRLYDFDLNCASQLKLKVGGVGLVAVDLLHKKQKLAKEMITFFLNHNRANQTNIVALYPFRPDFYKKMGFGYGTKKNSYKLKPDALPKNIGNVDGRLIYLTENDSQKMLNCYNRYAHENHGMFFRHLKEVEQIYKNDKNNVIGYEIEGKIEGYLVFQFKQEENKFLINDIEVQEMVYESREAFQELLSFLHKQNDQIRHIYYHTQDEDFHFNLSDPRNGTENLIPSVYHESNTQGIGLMYRIINVRKFFEDLKDYSFNGINSKVKFNITDSFFSENAGSVILSFQEGKPVVLADAEVEVEVDIDISDFSSLVLGAVTFSSLYQFGLANISCDSKINIMNTLFKQEQKPICLTAF
jgi:predicted acetyltransferase